MLIKIIKNGVESKWFKLTKQRHRELLEDAPDAAIILIDDLYPDSPDGGTPVKLDFSLFTLLARDFVLEENRQSKQIERNHDKRALEDISADDVQSRMISLEDEFQSKEQLLMLELAKQKLTPIQQRRLKLYIEKGYSMRAISVAEGVQHTAVQDCIRDALKKIKKFLD